MKALTVKQITIAAFLLIGLPAAERVSASDSDNKTVAIYGSFGFSDPNGDLAAGAEIGFYGLTRLSYAVAERVEATLGLDYHSMSLDATENFALSGKRFTATLLSVGLKVNPGELDAEVSPFLIAGGGMALVDFSDTLTGFSYPGGTILADSDLRPFMEFGGGFEFGQIQAWAKFSNVFLQGSDARFISFGIGGKLFLM